MLVKTSNTHLAETFLCHEAHESEPYIQPKVIEKHGNFRTRFHFGQQSAFSEHRFGQQSGYLNYGSANMVISTDYPPDLLEVALLQRLGQIVETS